MNKLKDRVKRVALFRWAYHCFVSFVAKDLFCRRAKVINKGTGRIEKFIEGSDNLISIGKNTSLSSPMFRIRGKDNRIIIGDNCIIGSGCSFWLEGCHITIEIGNDCTFTRLVHINSQENDSRIIIGNDCMFSNHIIVRTSDSHGIYDLQTMQRINPAKNVVIGSHVWIAPDTKVMKGVCVGNNSIIGSNSVVTKSVPENCLAVGMPARVVKEGVCWDRKDVIFGI